MNTMQPTEKSSLKLSSFSSSGADNGRWRLISLSFFLPFSFEFQCSYSSFFHPLPSSLPLSLFLQQQQTIIMFHRLSPCRLVGLKLSRCFFRFFLLLFFFSFSRFRLVVFFHFDLKNHLWPTFCHTLHPVPLFTGFSSSLYRSDIPAWLTRSNSYREY